MAVGNNGKVEARRHSGLVLMGLRDGEWFSPTIETATDSRIAHTGGHHGGSCLEHLESSAPSATVPRPRSAPTTDTWP